jgi:poly-gamma-glutamate synthesis protein (capsule biosynthesis protein)
VVIGNLETPLAAPRFPTSGFPRFNARVELAEGLAHAGFTHIGLANNHVLDRGVVGLESTIKAIESTGMRRFGVRMKEVETGFTIAVVEGLRIAVLGFTYGTNGISQPIDRPYLVNLLTEAVVSQQMAAARSRADIVVVCAHFGNEYQRLPSEYQRRWVRTFLELGADVVFGAHPHVLQPVEMFSVRQADGSEKVVPVFYSLGNFTAVQPGELTSTGAIGVVHFDFAEGRPKFQRIEAIPTFHGFMNWGGTRQYRVLPIRPEDLADLSSAERDRLTAIGQRAQRHLNQWLSRRSTAVQMN